ncbi:MAG: hypothetical protein K0R61_3056 [Microvirga sp.]|jgi:hypothetical protein|nr:hypothetical protein [Microvirga sp.]MDF2972606.1 hypothetical protein [Microvirga sp.]
MLEFPERHLIAGAIAVGVFFVGWGGIHAHFTRAEAFDLNSSLGPSGKGASLSEQTDRMGQAANRDSDHERARRGREYEKKYAVDSRDLGSRGRSRGGDASRDNNQGNFGGGQHNAN